MLRLARNLVDTAYATTGACVMTVQVDFDRDSFSSELKFRTVYLVV